MKELISLNKYIFNFHKNYMVNYESIFNYAKFLKQPLTLGMFIPCDEKGNVLEIPVNYEIWLKLHNNDVSSEKGTIGFLIHEEYQQAKENVLFEGFEIDIMQCGHKYAVNNKLQIVNDKDNGLYFLEIYSNKKPKEIFIKTIEDLIPYNLTLTKNAIDKHEL